MKKGFSYFTTIVGIILLVGGLVLIKTANNPQGILMALPYICVGIGCGVFGHGMGDLISQKIMDKNPEAKRQLDIEQNDERNIMIQLKAKAKAYDMMLFVFGALMVSFALMNVDLMVILMLVFAYIFVIGYGIYYRVKYDKKM